MAKTRNKYYNPNPLKKETDDCVVRALCKATDNDWDTVYKRLSEIAFDLKVMPNSDEAWQQYLIENGFEYKKLTIKKGMKRPRVNEFTRQNNRGTYVLRVANHIVTAKDGYYYDTWDSGDCAMYGYWEKSK